MPIATDNEQAFLLELYKMTSGDTNAKRSMHDVGAAIGLDKVQSGKMAEEIIGKGWAEIKTLSGGIGITADGIEAAQQAGAAPVGASGLKLSAGPVLSTEDRQTIGKILVDIKQAAAAMKSDYARLEEMVLDLKTIEVQLLSPKPKTAVIKELLRSLSGNFEQAGAKEIAGQLKGAIG
ncbi:MAG: hypothetical protein M0036_13935 [Desulfobacteraceae bacterium]|nr:hypothetical protein [Desulfobacteraceae bacterium]